MRVFWMIGFLLLAFPHGATAQDAPATEPLDCLHAIQGLSRFYRSNLQSQCLGLGPRYCAAPARSNPVACLTARIRAFEDFYAESRPMLEARPELSAAHAASYARAVRRADIAFGAQKSCRGLTVWDETQCHYLDLGAAVTDLFFALRLAQGTD